MIVIVKYLFWIARCKPLAPSAPSPLIFYFLLFYFSKLSVYLKSKKFFLFALASFDVVSLVQGLFVPKYYIALLN